MRRARVLSDASDDEVLLRNSESLFFGEDGESRPLLVLSIFIFCSQFQPSEPFLVDYLEDNVGLTTHQVYREVMNLYIYARLPSILMVGAMSTVPGCSCRRVLIAGAGCSLATNLLTRFGASLWAQQCAEFTVAAAVASRIAVMGLVFTVMPPKQFQACVHVAHATLLFSNFCSAVLGELLRDVAGVPLPRLLEISIFSQAIALVCSMWLPSERPDMSEDPLQPLAKPHPEYGLEDPGSRESLQRAQMLGVKYGLQESGSRESLQRAQMLGIKGGKKCFKWESSFKDPLLDLWRSLQLRVVFWWTVWALVMNPAHTFVLTYWQSLVRAKHFATDRNGYALASMYLAAGILTALSRHAAPLGSFTTVPVIGSILAAALITFQFTNSLWEFQLYGWLLLYQCIFHLGTAVSIFQVGSEVMQAARMSAASGASPTPRVGRITLLLSATGLLGSVNENIIQLAAGSFQSIEARLQLVCCMLAVAALVLTLAWSAESLLSWRQPNCVNGLLQSGDNQESSSSGTMAAPLLSVE